MALRLRTNGYDVTFEQVGEDFSRFTLDELDAMLIERTATARTAQAWTQTALQALVTTAEQERRAVAYFGSQSEVLRAVALDINAPGMPAHLKELQRAFGQASRDEAAARVALTSVRSERKRRKDQATHAAITERHARLSEQRESNRQAALRASVNAVVRKPRLLDRVDALLGR